MKYKVINSGPAIDVHHSSGDLVIPAGGEEICDKEQGEFLQLRYPWVALEVVAEEDKPKKESKKEAQEKKEKVAIQKEEGVNEDKQADDAKADSNAKVEGEKVEVVKKDEEPEEDKTVANKDFPVEANKPQVKDGYDKAPKDQPASKSKSNKKSSTK